MESTVYWIWLSLAATPDSATFPRLLAFFDGAKEIYEADIKEISRAIGYNASDRRRLAKKDLTKAQEIFEFCKKHDVGILTYSDDAFPASLRTIPTPPVLLYYRGKLPDFNRGVYVASVGTRSLSDYGRRSAFKICYDLATAGATVVSGMAAGIDGVSHAATLAAGAPTVAVLGSGIDICYPAGHLRLAREIVKCGCVITEFAPKTPPLKCNFPRRNRIISGLSAATLVIEGSEKSGALITARHAQAQGRTVYALPGAVGHKNSEASNLLIKGGARLITSAEDIIKDFDNPERGLLNPFNLKLKIPRELNETLSYYGVIAVSSGDDIFEAPRPKRRSNAVPKPNFKEKKPLSPPAEPAPTDGLDSRALTVYKRIPRGEVCSIESLVCEEYSLRDVMKTLLRLEMAGFVMMLPGESVKRKFD